MKERQSLKKRNVEQGNTTEIIAEDVQKILNEKNSAPSPQPKKQKKKSTPYIVISYAFVFIFVALIGYVVYFNVMMRDQILSSPYNKRQDSQAQYVVRGNIESADGKILATTQTASDGTVQRVYPYSNVFAHAVGYASNGKSGLESSANYDLLTSHISFIQHIMNEFNNTKDPGDTVTTTLDTNLQQAAYNALGDYRGAVIVMNPKTGAILAMVSKPDFDPNTIAADWNDIISGNGSQLVNRVTSGSYPPGSIFKIVTSLAYFRQNATFDGFSFDCTGSVTIDGNTVHCSAGEVHGQEDFTKAFAESCNSAFAQIGVSLGGAPIRSAAESLLMNKSLPCDFSYKESSVTVDGTSDVKDLMQTAFGQGETTVTPYGMALIVSAIANDGVLMKPYIISGIRSTDGTDVSRTQPEKYASLMTQTEASQLKELMKAVVSEGTAVSLSGEDYQVAGKTGSAEYTKADGTTGTHSWFVGFSNPDDPDLAFAVIAEDGGLGSSTAVPMTKSILNAYYYKD